MSIKYFSSIFGQGHLKLSDCRVLNVVFRTSVEFSRKPLEAQLWKNNLGVLKSVYQQIESKPPACLVFRPVTCGPFTPLQQLTR